ncbi:hypothetical protein [Streptacidiphilus sp. P02-A3a]|uniref:hypothetical protein n=1 Tax=Streptacidiphilus sp. P02-A3a TaxID=2704468 RepID=UPI0015FE74B9|nr:hypothetical protein [Streptacidiphilus sp. P02-A3a]QMU72003.1 hypothetical protein GXP74_30980 [Streptacidiphilus sp. P02-A3a]
MSIPDPTASPSPDVAHLTPMRLAALASLAFSRAGGTQVALLTDADDKGGDLAVVETALSTRPPILHPTDLAGG